MAELFAPQNLLENCQGLQEVIALSPPDEKSQAGSDVKAMIREEDLHFHGARKLEIHSLSAYALPDGLTMESEIFPAIRFGELYLRGHLAQVAYMQFGRIQSLAWMMVDSTVRRDGGDMMIGLAGIDEYDSDGMVTESQFIAEDRRIPRPLYLPVGMIESVLIAA